MEPNRRTRTLRTELRYDDLRYDGESFRDDAFKDPTPEGWVRVKAVIGRGDVVLPYRRADGSVRWEFRPASEVTDEESVRSFDALPVTNEHPPVHLNADNVSTYQAGQSATAKVDGVRVENDLVITSKRLIADAQAGKRQVSPGYRVDLDETPGVFKGQRYDAVQRNIRGNHIAIVPLGRQGPEVALRMDSADAVLAFDLIGRNDDMPEKNDPKTAPDGAPKTKADSQEIVDAVMARLDMAMKPIAEKMDMVDKLAARVDEMGSMLTALSKKPEDDKLPKTDGADAPAVTVAKMDAETQAKLDALELKSAKLEEKLTASEAQRRADAEEADRRADVLADAKRVIGDDYTGRNDSGAAKSRVEIMRDVVLRVDGDDAKAALDREASKVRTDAPDTEGMYVGYVGARFEMAMREHAKRADHADSLLDAARKIERGDGDDDREDAATKAKNDALARRKDRWKTSTALAAR